MSLILRLAQKNDLEAIVTIYNQAIAKKGLTADLDIQNVQDKIHWFNAHSPNKFPIFVALQNDTIVGWFSLSAYREGRKALQETAEISLYLDHNHLGKGIGSNMMMYAIEQAKQIGYRHLIAILIGSNSRSIALFTKFNFECWGTLPGIVAIENQNLDHCFYGIHL